MSTLRHDAFVYDTDHAFVDAVGSFLADGLAGGEAAYVVGDRDRCAQLRDELGTFAADVTFIDAHGWYDTPARTLAECDRTLRAARADGVPGVRIVGEFPFALDTSPLDRAEWTRYESVINRAFAPYPAWIVCGYDARRFPHSVLGDAARTHEHTLEPDGTRVASDAFVDPCQLVTSLPIARGTLVESIDIGSNPRPARTFVRRTAEHFGVTSDRIDGLCVAISELATNAIVHGAPPVSVHAYHDGDDLVYEVRDAGPGIDDPFAGFLPPTPTQIGGVGLWLARQLSDRLEVESTSSGTSVTMLVRGPGSAD